MRNFTRTWEEGRRPINASAQTNRLKFFMRVSTACMALIVTTSLHFLQAETVHSQTIENTYVEVKFSSGSLKNIFSAIEEQTNFMFVFPPDLIEKYANIDLKEGAISVKKLLDSVLDCNGLTYRQSGNNIIVSAKLKSGKTNSLSSRLEMMQVKGKVVDKEGAPMAGVNVVVRGTTNGTATDADGAYSIEASSNDWLVFSFIGYKKMEILVGERTVIDLALEEDAQALQEVVVGTSYYTMVDDRKTANIVKITSKEIQNQPVTSPLLALQGRVAGLQITPNSGVPGGAPTIRVRGENSLRTNGGYPLYIIDGVMIDSSPLQSVSNMYYLSGGVDPLANLNPENIESIEVLKDADATAIYGSRGANGVIIVTTKQGKKTNGPVNLDLSLYSGQGKIPQFMDLLNTPQYLEMRREAFKNSNRVPSFFDFDLAVWDSTRYTDWQKVLLGGTANITDMQANFSGGTDNTSFRFGGSYHKESNLVSDDFGYRRSSANFSFNHHTGDGKFVLSFTSNYGVTVNKSLDLLNFLSNALLLPPNAPALYNEDGDLNWELTKIGDFELSTFSNPMAELLKANESTVSSLMTDANISYKILPKLMVRANLGYTDTNGEEIVKTPIASQDPSLIQPGSTASARFGTQDRNSWIIEPQILYNNEWKNHNVDALVGTTIQEITGQYRAISATGYNSDVLLNSLKGANEYSYDADENFQYRYCAFFARVGYDFKRRYLLNLTGRRDGSSRFGPGNRYGNFGAIGAAWILSDEPFMERLSKQISFAKFRASYGVTGNDQIGDYQFYNLFTIGQYRYQDGTTLLPKGLFNRDFNWEVTRKLEASFEFSVLENRRISFLLTWYRNRSSNQLVNYQLPATTGFQSILTNFNATVENRGWEFGIQSQNIQSADVSWTTSFNFTIPRNKLISFPGIETSPYATVYKVGEPLSARRLYHWTGVDKQTGNYTFVDANDSGDIEDTDKFFGNPSDPKLYGGVMNTIRYRSLELSFLFQFADKTALNVYANAPGRLVANQPVGVLSRWQKEGDETDIAKFGTSSATNRLFQQMIQSDVNVVDASFIKLKTVSISYNLPFSILDKAKIREAQIFGQGQNLLTWTGFSGLDPETGARVFPQLRSVTAGFRVKF